MSNPNEPEEPEDWYRRRQGWPFREIDPQPASKVPAVIVLVFTVGIIVATVVLALRS